MSTLYNLYRHDINLNDPENYEDLLESLTVKDVKKAMKRLYKGANVVDLVFSPDETDDPEVSGEAAE
jgi:zinc protease